MIDLDQVKYLGLRSMIRPYRRLRSMGYLDPGTDDSRRMKTLGSDSPRLRENPGGVRSVLNLKRAACRNVAQNCLHPTLCCFRILDRHTTA